MAISMGRKTLGIILGVGLVYRLPFLARRQLWTDELIQALAVRSDSLSALLHRLRGGIGLPTPLDPIIQRGVVFFLGESNWALRLHSVLLSALSLWLFFRVSRSLFGERVALYSTVLFAIYPLHYHYSQEGLPYALLTFLTLLSYDLMFRLVAHPEKNGWGWLCWLLTQVLLLYSSFVGIAILLSQCAALALSSWPGSNVHTLVPEAVDGEGKPDAPRAGVRTALIFISLAALACVLLWPWARFAWAWHPVSHPESLNFRLLLRIIKELGDGSYPVSGLLILGIATGAVTMFRHGRVRSLLWFASWFALPFPVVFLLDRWAGNAFTIGQILPCTPPLLLAAGYGLSYLGERLSILEELPLQPSSPALVYAVALAVGSIIVAQSHWRREPVDWTGTARFLQESLRSGDRLTIPRGRSLLEYYAPSLSEFGSVEVDSASLTPMAGQEPRRFMVCLAGSNPDPCATFRKATAKDSAWSVREFSGLTVYIRGK